METFKSKRVWVIIVMFVINGVAAIHNQIPADSLPYVDALLALLGVWFGIPAMTTK